MSETVKVANRSGGIVIYSIPELHVRREFGPTEVKEIAVSELQTLSQRSGGKTMLEDYLMVMDKDVINRLLNHDVEPEYWLKEADIPKWINACSLEEFKDALDFAPDGTKELIKQYAISVPLQSYDKMAAMKEQLGFDALKAIELSKPDANEKQEVKNTARRSNATSIEQPADDAPTQRRSAAITINKPE